MTTQRPQDAGSSSDSSVYDFKELNLPERLAEPANLQQGSILLAGIIGSGKSATIAALLELFREDSRPLIRSSLVFTLQAIVGLKLLPGIQADLARVPC